MLNKNKNKNIVLAAGGTGGHLFPAKALGQDLINRGYQVHIITDKRALKIINDFDGANVYVVRSDSFSKKPKGSIIASLYNLIYGSFQSLKIFIKIRPQVVGGFGGYPTLPPMMVATMWLSKLFGIKTFIHEQNAVMGRANKLLAKRVNIIASGFLPKEGPFKNKIIITGNPVRNSIIKASAFLYSAPSKNGDLKLLVFGGSQGASIFSDVLPKAISMLEPSYRRRIILTQQARGDQLSLENHYRSLGVMAQIKPFFADLADKMRSAHFIISRSGASTVSELAVIGRPCLLVPYPHAIDNDQLKNAQRLQETGNALVVEQKDFTAQKLSEILKDLLDNPQQLKIKAKLIKKAGNPQSTNKLVEIVEQLSKRTKNESTD